jgi:hypothetical protein
MLLAPKLRASVMRLDSGNALRLTYLIFKCLYVPVSCHSCHVEFGSLINPVSKEKHLHITDHTEIPKMFFSDGICFIPERFIWSSQGGSST